MYLHILFECMALLKEFQSMTFAHFQVTDALKKKKFKNDFLLLICKV